MMYQPIEKYGLIGNMHTAALVSKEGSIDWMCWPRFDSPSVFAAILDDKKGGRFQIAPAADGFKTQQYYWPDTNVLITRFLGADAAGEVIDFMPMFPALPQQPDEARPLIRLARSTRGAMPFRLVCQPAFNYARDAHETKITADGATFDSNGLTLALASSVRLQSDGRVVTADFTLETGQMAAFRLAREEASPSGAASPQEALDLMEQTVAYWREWLSRCSYQGRWREWVHRSALALELMVYEPTGAVIAAPTTSLPEWVGGGRNWDYRCSWIRDSAFTVYALLRVGLSDEALRFMGWIEARCREIEQDGTLQTVYGIDGRRTLTEETLGHLEGYRGSRPVRVGNAASEQLQIDIYGELIDSIYLFNKYVDPISYELWNYLRRMVDWVAVNCMQPDSGIWEVRGDPQHFVYSKLMCWVALDRGIRLAVKRAFPADLNGWLARRDELYEEIMHQGWNAQRQSFVQRYDGAALDASALMMPMVFFMSPSDPRMISTLKAIGQPPEEGGLFSDGAILRYNLAETQDGVKGHEGTFNMCSFWYVEALTRAGGRDEKQLGRALMLFEQCLKRANHVGLFSEESGPSGEALGNFPQAFTHLGLISAAFNLNRALGGS
ncbi:MAG TPA: glycoside hydrolase family 15 protein [Terriglobia bacterium]|nr:glycoside hydrolase family 15 protein [Terriglobia bacterium]